MPLTSSKTHALRMSRSLRRCVPCLVLNRDGAMKHPDEGFLVTPKLQPNITMPMRLVHSRHPIEYETKPSILVINLVSLQSYGQTTKMSPDSFRRDCGVKGSPE